MNTRVLLIALFSVLTYALNNGVGRTPAMGYNTWNDFRCDISDKDIRSVADAIVSQNLHKYGYVYLNMDDCWASGRDSSGRIYPDPNSFPNGIKSVADYVHSKGLKFGIYTDRGTQTCAGRPGSEGYETIDAQTYASWGVDYLKEDSCYASGDHNTAFKQYGLMRDALNATGRDIYFSLCGWNSWYAPNGWNLGNSWRIAGDCNHWNDVLNAIDTNSPLTNYARPGGWNDPDMLLGSTPGSAASLTPVQSRTMFSMWSVMAAPLLIGSHIQQLSSWDLQTYTNTEVIAIDQDPLGLQGVRIAGGNLIQGSNTTTFNVWAKKLSSSAGFAVIFLNNDSQNANVVCDETCFKNMGFVNGDTIAVRDVWLHKDLAPIKTLSYSVPLSKSGGSSLFIFKRV
eukprot:TRINITY_DN8256_c0_g1_i1.p1 TRINITY_DN8256_c0_g1~~TRINITY_DN8256_c0_g1_i1.p1  ORF type:complete len:406 (-),score=65.20 TRINITY_DN8256_c0_g1_i1:56-1246(-)